MAYHSKHNWLYAALLHMYPAPFRQQYGHPMTQTLQDMLEDQPSTTGRLAVWIRTIINLPFSALGQHLNVKGGYIMTRKMMIAIGCTLLALVIVGVGSFWLGRVKTEESAGIARVSTTTLADAMQQDQFYSNYGNATLLFHGKVASTELVNGLTIVTFASNSKYGIACRFISAPRIKIGDDVQIVAPGGQAIRQPFGVLLRSCEAI